MRDRFTETEEEKTTGAFLGVWIKASQYIGFLYYGYYFNTFNMQDKICLWLAVVYFEKLYASIFKLIGKPYVTKWIENNYSALTQLAPNLPIEISGKMLEYLPEPLKKSATIFIQEFTTSTNEYIIRLLDKNIAPPNANIQLAEPLNEHEAKLLIKTLETKHVPSGLKINYEAKNIPKYLHKKIQDSLQLNKLKQSALACITLQQGYRDKSSSCYKLPAVILEKICSYTYPLRADPEGFPHFLAKISLFKHKDLLAEKRGFLKREVIPGNTATFAPR